MALEELDLRMIAAIRLIDATTRSQINSRMIVAADGARITRNRSGYYVIVDAEGFKDYVKAFKEAPATDTALVELKIADPSGQYLPRRCEITIPRDASPENAGEDDSIFKPVEVEMFPSPTARTLPGWAVIRATVRREGSDETLAWALIRVIRNSDNVPLATAQTDHRGEALVAVPGIPVTTWAAGDDDDEEGPVMATTIAVRVEVVLDPQAASGPASRYVPDPDKLKESQESATKNFNLASGQVLVADLQVTVI